MGQKTLAALKEFGAVYLHAIGGAAQFYARCLKTTGVDLLEELCLDCRNPDLVNPEFRILVVDDDPVARRAISGAIQLAFPKPDSADTGEEALAKAADKLFDVIFLDVQMPGMDGFTTCARIRATTLNARSPVVFVTVQNDDASRQKAAAVGGNAFIGKPALAAEITLRALTLALRSRLEKASAAPACAEPVAAAVS